MHCRCSHQREAPSHYCQEEESTAYQRRIDEVVADDEDLGPFLSRLEEAYDAEDDAGNANPADLIAEVERFLRDQP